MASAIPFYLRTLELNKDNADVRYKLAQSFLKTGQRDQAIRSLEEMLKANPLKFEIYEFLARLYEEAGNKERALANYEQALLLAPNQPENYLHTAGVELELKQYDRAISTLEEARRRFPIPQITYSLAIALSTAKRYCRSSADFRSGVAGRRVERRGAFRRQLLLQLWCNRRTGRLGREGCDAAQEIDRARSIKGGTSL